MVLLLVPYTDDEDATWSEYARKIVNFTFDFNGTCEVLRTLASVYITH